MSSSNGASSAEPAPHSPDVVNLRITYLLGGNPRPPHNVGAVPADTTIGALRLRLQTELLETPTPQEQRLIYQGRPLLQDNQTLREALRIDGPAGLLPYTLQIIIQTRPAASHYRPPQMASAPATDGMHAGQPHPPGTMLTDRTAEDDMREVDDYRRRFDQFIQQGQQMALQHHHLQLHQQQHQHQHTGAMLHQQTEAMLQQHRRAVELARAQHQRQVARIAQATQQLETPDGPQENPAVATTNGQPASQSVGLPQPPLIDAPGISPSFTQPQASAQRPQRLDTQAPVQMPRPLSTPPLPRPGHFHTQLPTLANPNFPLPRPGHFPPQVPRSVFPLFEPSRPAAPQTQDRVWLLSSPQGPRALLFSPNHGYFTSTPPIRRSLVQDAIRTRIAGRTTVRTTAANPPAAAAAGAVANPLPGQVALRQPAQPAAGAAAQNPNDGFLALVNNRAWLFLRLYMFAWVLSEPGTWRRWSLLGLAVLISLLPTDNPINTVLRVARRHFDALVGPPQPQPRPIATAQLPNGTAPNATGQPPQGTVNITPEEAAARIIRERNAAQRQRQANPNVMRDLLYRIEQALALFLASLVPGVGERHVAAREEQRRLEMQAEMERINAARAREAAAEAALDTSTQPSQGAGNAESTPASECTTETTPTEGASSAAAEAVPAPEATKSEPAAQLPLPSWGSVEQTTSTASTSTGVDTLANGYNATDESQPQPRARHATVDDDVPE
ncbi:uncharacterized protein AB675_5805 [Cyphellophora attinorum]|uniref:Uncharacterized protein n=1 Tax=Cyphellophora attinorum TaxID=1664694 RepID=A0A0N1H789_9EURO|nr:uncharacterized protein AB675_5805 [Phialophora attinorum]KPI38782.1 hypothetical protein AB675_5805 [Phialophora attinorum]